GVRPDVVRRGLALLVRRRGGVRRLAGQVTFQDRVLHALELRVRLGDLALAAALFPLPVPPIRKVRSQRLALQHVRQGARRQPQAHEQAHPPRLELILPAGQRATRWRGASASQRTPERGEGGPDFHLPPPSRRGASRSARLGKTITLPLLPASWRMASISFMRAISGDSESTFAVLARARAAASSCRALTRSARPARSASTSCIMTRCT